MVGREIDDAKNKLPLASMSQNLKFIMYENNNAVGYTTTLVS